MITEIDKQFLKRAMRLAMNGRGHTEPNPSVGCVLVKNGQTLGEGWTQAFGGAHAEPTALADCKSRGNDPTGATAYVTLEPCCHTNKKTPPCAPRLIEAKIARVVIGCLDPNPDVNGKGVAMLRNAGIEVDCLPGAKPSGPLAPVPRGEGQGEGERTGRGRSASEQHKALTPALSQEERELNASHFQQLIAPFISSQNVRDSYFTLKWAESADGRVAGENGARIQITNVLSNRIIHQLRSRCGSIVVGINTVLSDDPELTVRGIEMKQMPTRVVLDRNLRIPTFAKLIETNQKRIGGHLLIVCSPKIRRDSPRVAELEALHAQVTEIKPELDTHFGLELAISDRDEIQHNRHELVEPGPTLARSLLPIAERLWVFRSPIQIKGGPSAPRAAVIPDHYIAVGQLNLAGDVLTEYLNTQSPAYFAPVPSADFVLAQEDVASTCP